MPLAPLFGERYYEARDKVHGMEYVIACEPIPARAHLGAIRYDYTLFSDVEIDADLIHGAQISAWYIPVFNDDAAATVTSLTAAKQLFDRAAPKVGPNIAATAIAGNAAQNADLWTPVNAEYTIGDVDTDLLWQPGRIPLSVLTNPVQAAEIFRDRVIMGWSEGNAYRTGTAPRDADAGAGTENRAQVKTMVNRQGLIRKGINTQTPGYVMWVLTIPTDVSDDAYDQWATLMPRQNLFETLNFLAPTVDRISGNMLIYPGTDDDWLRWAFKYQTTGDRQWKQDACKLGYRLHLFYHFSREAVGMTVDANDKVQ